jgi:hypothetical protein
MHSEALDGSIPRMVTGHGIWVHRVDRSPTKVCGSYETTCTSRYVLDTPPCISGIVLVALAQIVLIAARRLVRWGSGYPYQASQVRIIIDITFFKGQDQPWR